MSPKLLSTECIARGNIFIAELKIPLVEDTSAASSVVFVVVVVVFNRKMNFLICLKYIQLCH